MLDRYLLSLQHRVLRPPARWLKKGGVTADAITLIGFSFGMTAAVLLAQQSYEAALAAILVNRLCDGLDGALARETSLTDRGAFIDIALDFFFYGAVPFGFALADPPTNALAACALLLTFIGSGSSFLAFSAIAARRGASSPVYPQKGIYYLGGLTEGAETILAFIAMCLWPGYFPVIAWTFAAMALITTFARWWWGWKMFSK